MTAPIQVLSKVALRHPETEEGIACAGTAIETRTVKVRHKAFVFLGLTHARVKLDASLPDAARLAAKHPGRFDVGAHGWVKATFSREAPPDLTLLGRWIDESYRVMRDGSRPPKQKARR